MADRNGRRYSDHSRLAGLQKQKKPKEHTAGNTVTRLWRTALIALPILHGVRAPPEAVEHTFLAIHGPHGEI